MEINLVRADGEVGRAQLLGLWGEAEEGALLSGIVLAPAGDDRSRLVDLAERYRTLAEVSADIIVAHQDSRIVYANPATLSTLRVRRPAELEGKTILSFFAPASRQVFIQRVATMTEEGSVSDFSKAQVIALDGTIVDIEATSIRTSSEDGL